MHEILTLNILELQRLLAQIGYGYGGSSVNWPAILLWGIGLAVVGFMIWMIIDCATRPVQNKVMWLLLMILGLFFGGGIVGIIAAIIYALTDRNKVQVIMPMDQNPVGEQASLEGGYRGSGVDAPAQQSQTVYVKTMTTTGKIIAAIAAVLGAATLAAAVLIMVALIQCARDPKCI